MSDADDLPTLILPGHWQGRAAGHPSSKPRSGALLRMDPAAGAAVLSQDGRELRFTLPGGDLLALLHVALAVHADVPVSSWPGQGEPPGVAKAPDIVLSGRTGPAAAAVRIVEAGLHHLLANARAAIVGNMEGIHQMRVALRRLRTGLALFGPHLDEAAAAALSHELRAMGRLLGVTRDWDVFCLDLLPGVQDGALDEAHRQGLQETALLLRRSAHEEMARNLNDATVLALVRGIAGWTAAAGAGHAGETLQDAAPALLSLLERKVRRRGRHLARRSEEELHALRRATKQLRYGVEYLRPLFKAKAVKPYLNACERLGERLGEFNDSVNALRLARDLAVHRPELHPATEALTSVLRRRRDDALPHVHDGWRAFSATEPFWV